MKMIGIIIIVLGLVSFNSVAKETPDFKSVRSILSAVPAPELPVKSAELVKNASMRERESTTINVVKAAVSINPAAAPLIVGAIAKAAPEMAATAAAAAAAMHPGQASAIAKAAAATAPAKAAPIVAAVCAAVPKDYRNVAIAVSEVAPAAGKEILKSVGTAVPDMRAAIDKEVVSYGLSVPPVAATLDKVALAGANHSGQGASATPPSVPTSGTPLNNDPNTRGSAPTGGRNYARP
ncbi:MAG TPA: hypothetical protein VEC99_03650 [Clostridia bacterium]|nr:hypothetical protein [Clostridia bacterium]